MELSNAFVISAVNSGLSLIMGFVMLFLNRFSYKVGTGYWAAGSLVIGVTFLLRAVFPANDALMMTVVPIFVSLGFYLYLAGIWRFKDKGINYWILLGLPLLDALQILVFYKFPPLYKVQFGIHSLIIVVYYVLAIYEMLRLSSDQKYLKKIFLLNALSFFISLLIVLVLTCHLICNHSFESLPLSSVFIFCHIINGFLMVALTFGFLSAVNLRLNMGLEGQIASNMKFLSIIAHDLRGPVGNITNFLELLQDESKLSDKQRKGYLQLLNSLSQSTFHLLQNLLEWATKAKNLNNSKRERIELNQLIADKIDFFKAATTLKSIDLKFISAGNFAVTGNINMLKTIVRNLISNAIKFTPNGGAITVTTDRILTMVRLTVSDTGEGMKPEAIDSFYKFESNTSTIGTNGEVGSGLGLVLCKELTSKMNGIINIESKSGVGTKVILDLPSAE